MKMNFKKLKKGIEKEKIRFSTELYRLDLQENVHYRAIPMFFANHFSIRGSFIFYTQNGMSVMCYGNQTRKKRHHLKSAYAGVLGVNQYDMEAVIRTINQTKQKIKKLKELVQDKESSQNYMTILEFLKEGQRNHIKQGFQLTQWSSDSTFDYFISSYSCLSPMGTIYVRCSDGILSLPILEDQIDRGDEQFTLLNAKWYSFDHLVPIKEEVTYAIKQYEENIKWLEKLHQTIRLKLIMTS